MTFPKPEFDTNHWEAWISTYNQRATGFGSDALNHYLRDGDGFRAKAASRLLQLMEIPSFEPVFSYEIFQTSMFGMSGDGVHSLRLDRFYLVRTIWRQEEDMKNFGRGLTDAEKHNYHPVLEYKHIEITKAVVDKVYAGFKEKIPIWFYPNVEEDYQGLDGTSYELALGGAFLGVRYRWWSHTPSEWTPLSSVLEESMWMFEAILK